MSGASERGPMFRLDPSYRRPGGGPVIIGGSPLRLFRLSQAGRRVAEVLERGETLPVGHGVLTDRLYDAGAIHRVVAGRTAGFEAAPTHANVTAVVPARVSARCVIGALADVSRTVVVDDAGPGRVEVGGADVELITRRCNGGPGAARNTGLDAVTTPFVAFVDTDVIAPPGWLETLLGHFADPHVGLVAPRVRSAAGGSALVDRYEAVHGSLDLGAQEGRVAPGSRIGYVPGAAIVCRTDAIRAVGAFDDALRYGEDVDLVWRLHEAGWRCRYEPAVEVWHEARPTLLAWLEQRYRYGTSAAPLATRHPGALAPLRISGWSAAVWALLASRRPFAAVAVAVGTTAALQHKLHGLPANESARLAGLGHLHAGAQIAAALRRAWWPVAVVGGVSIRRARPWLVVAAVLPAAVLPAARNRPGLARGDGDCRDDGGRRSLALPAFVAMRLADDMAYGVGLWAGCLRSRSLAALRPDLADWPPRRTSTVGRR